MKEAMRQAQRGSRAWLAVLLSVLGLAVLVLPASAAAHASLIGTDPSNESTIEAHPSVVSITFSENVTTPFGAVRVYGPDGARVERGSASADDGVVTVPISARESGTYAVSWRVTSADGHPVRGAFVFHVEESSADTVSRDAALAASEGSRAKDVAFGIARLGVLLGVVLAVGGVVFAGLAAGAWQPVRLRASLLLALVSMAAAYVLDASISAGLPIAEALTADVLVEQASTVYGGATVVRFGVLIACAACVPLIASARWKRPSVRYAVTVPFVALAATLSISGHAVGDSVTAARLPLDMVHSIVAAVWLGGLVQLVAWSRVAPVDGAVLQRWSRAALISVVLLVATGLWAAWEEIGVSVDGVLSTPYGRLVLVKFVLLLAILPIANLNRVRAVPAVRAGGAGAVEQLRRYVRAEIGIALLVLLATAWLIQTPPAKTQLAPAFVEKTLELRNGATVQLVIDPAAVGANEVHLYAFDGQQQVDADVDEVTLTANNAERGLGPLDIELLQAGPGHFTTRRATIPFAGEWSFDAAVKRGKFDEERARFSVSIAPSNQE